MANKLTGDYEAVLHIRLDRINGLLATLHQTHEEPGWKYTFPHRASFRLGDRTAVLPRERSVVMQWTRKAFERLRATTAGGARELLLAKAPWGLKPMLDQGIHDLDAVTMIVPGDVRGRVYCQLSNPTITIPPGGSQVTVHVGVRARFQKDDGAANLPKPIYGEITADYVVTLLTRNGRQVLRVRITSDDSKIKFLPEPVPGQQTLTPVLTEVIAKQVRTVLREQLVALDVELPSDFEFTEFKALDTEAAVVPLSLSGAALPAGALGTVTNAVLVKGNDFAVAVSQEYMKGSLDVTQSVRDYIAQNVKTENVTITVQPVTVTWKAGGIDIGGSIHAATPWWLWDVDISFTQGLEIVLDPTTQAVSIRPTGDPYVNGSFGPFGIPDTQLKSLVRGARDSALPAVNDKLDPKLRDARNRLESAFKTFDPTGSAVFRGIEVTAEGIIVRGSLETKVQRGKAVVLHRDVDVDGVESVSAYESWIPGGRIDSFEWAWVVGPGPLETQPLVEHSFTYPKPSKPIEDVCLRISGRYRTVKGDEASTEEVDCSYSSHAPFVVSPGGAAQVVVPQYFHDHGDPPPGDPGANFVLSDRIAGHVSLVKDVAAIDSITMNTLVHFTGPLRSRPLEGLARALGMMQRRDVSLLTVLVSPTGTLHGRRDEIQERLGPPAERFGAALVLTEDYAGGWSKTFAASDGPSTHLVNARAEFVWRRDGELDAGAVARALDEHALPAPPPRRVPLRLSVRPGARARDTVFIGEQGDYTSLLRLRGRRVLLLFWQSWSVPCLLELRRLDQALSERGAPFVLAVNGGEDPEVLAEVRRSNGFSVPFISDPSQRIAALYGVRCWPTSVSINEAGIVDRVQFGLTHAAREPAAVATPDRPARR